MFHKFFAFAITLSLSAICTNALAENERPPVADINGDYNSIQRLNNAGDEIQGVRGEQRFWRVLSAGLNCRFSPGTNHQIIRQFAKNDIIKAASFGRGGSDEVIVIQRDNRGKPWLRVELNSGQCFVRANSRFITPAQ